MSRNRLFIYRLLPGLLLLLGWELLVLVNTPLEFYFGRPSQVGEIILSGLILDGTLIDDVAITFVEAGAGFVIGNAVGTLLGMSLWFSNRAFAIAKPYIVGLGSAPIFALGPLLIVWFGTGVEAKIAIAAMSTVFIALFQAFQGASEASEEYLVLMDALGADQWTKFRKVVAPSSAVWVISAFKLNVGFALLGAFIGEFFSAEAGVGNMIIVATGLFQVSRILAGVVLFVGIAMLFNWVISRYENTMQKWVSSVS